MAGAVGIEPTLEVLETSVLPLNYAPKLVVVEGDGFEPPNPEGADLQSAAFSHFATPPQYMKLRGVKSFFIKKYIPYRIMVPARGLEPPTY